MSALGPVGLYGKIEAQADFFRVNAGEFSQAGVDRWLESALETMRGEGGRLPEGPTGFLLAPRGSSRVFLGAFASSQDAAGRTFPLVVFTHLSPPKQGNGPLHDLTSLFMDHCLFASAAGALAVDGGRKGAADLCSQAEGLLLADEPANPSTVLDVEGFANQSTESLLASVNGSPRALAYGLRTIGLACEQASKYGPDAANGVITVDAPSPDPAALWLWLELVARRLNWRDGLPSILWTLPLPQGNDNRNGKAGRLLVTLGPPSPAVLGFLANPRHRSSRFWPLRTEVTAAIDQAWQAISPDQRALLENPATSLGQLADAFGGLTPGG